MTWYRWRVRFGNRIVFYVIAPSAVEAAALATRRARLLELLCHVTIIGLKGKAGLPQRLNPILEERSPNA